MLMVRRLLLLLVVIWTAASLNFFLPRMTDRNPIEERLAQAVSEGGSSGVGIQEMVEAYKKRFGLNQPLWRQYLNFLGDSLRLDLGVTIAYYPTRVSTMLLQALPWTIGLIGTATLISFVLGTVLGALTVWAHSPRWLNWFVPWIMMLAAIPFYLIGLVLIYFLVFRLGWFPSGGGYGVGIHPALVVDLRRRGAAALPAAGVFHHRGGHGGLGAGDARHDGHRAG